MWSFILTQCPENCCSKHSFSFFGQRGFKHLSQLGSHFPNMPHWPPQESPSCFGHILFSAHTSQTSYMYDLWEMCGFELSFPNLFQQTGFSMGLAGITQRSPLTNSPWWWIETNSMTAWKNKFNIENILIDASVNLLFVALKHLRNGNTIHNTLQARS